MKQIYLDADDDITEVINKLEYISSDRIALIPPKRSTALQSVVNLKLLKKAAGSNENELVLVTKDPVIINVASQLKMMTAPNLETEPQIPEPRDSQPLPSDTIDATERSEGDYRAANEAAEDVEEKNDASAKGKHAKTGKKPKASAGTKVPDFNRFKKRILLGLLLLLLIVAGLWWVLVIAPHAQVTIDGLTQDARADFHFVADANLEESDFENSRLAAELEQQSRTLSTDFEATGTETVGERATGEVTIVNCQTFPDDSITISSGTALTAANGLVYRATENVTISGSSSDGHNEPCNEDGREVVPVEADDIGEQYNISPTDYTVDGYDSEGVYSSGSTSMSGGEEEEVSVLAASDIESARQELLDNERDDAEEELRDSFDDELVIIGASFRDVVDSTSSQPEEGEETEQAQLIVEVTYSLLAVERLDMEELLLRAYRGDDEDAELLGIIESGLEEAEFSATDEENRFAVVADGVLGPDIDESELKEEIAGMDYGDAIDRVEEIPNVRNVNLRLEPFWTNLIGRVPNNPDKINIEFEITEREEEADDNDSGD